MASVTNLRHLLAEDGTIAPDSDPEWTLANFFVGIVAWVTSGAGSALDDDRTDTFCLRRTDPACRGLIFARLTDAGDIDWSCPACGDGGSITGWEETDWDHTHGDDESPDLLAQAKALVHRAWAVGSDREAVALAHQALELSTDCADAYLTLAAMVKMPAAGRLDLVQRAVEAGERALGPRYFAEEAGGFWELIETRPYLRAVRELVFILWERGESEAAIDHSWELLYLDHADNLFIRYMLAYYLLEKDDLSELSDLLDMFQEDESTELMYTRALLAFKEDGEGARADAALGDALASNRHVPGYLLGRYKPPKDFPDTCTPGEPDEAVRYSTQSKGAWMRSSGALRWLKHKAPPGLFKRPVSNRKIR